MDHSPQSLVEQILGQSITSAPSSHNWQRTHSLLQTMPSALYYTDNATDTELAQKSGADRLDDGIVYIYAMTTAAEHGWVDAFQVLHERCQCTVANYEGFILASLQSNTLSILSLPTMVAQMPNITTSAIELCLRDITQNNTRVFIVDFLLSHIADRLAEINTAKYLYDAIARGAYGIVKVFVKYGLVPLDGDLIAGNDYTVKYNQNWKPLWLAVRHGHLNIVRLLLADPRAKDIRLLPLALTETIKQRYTEIAQLLLVSGIAELHSIYLPLAVKSGCTEMVAMLLSHQPATVFSAKDLQQAVILAADNELPEIAALLT